MPSSESSSATRRFALCALPPLPHARPSTPIAHHTRSHILAENPWSILDTTLMLFQLEMFAHASKHPFSELAKAHPTGREYTEREMDAMRLGISEDELVAARSVCPQAANDTLSQAAIFACEAVKRRNTEERRDACYEAAMKRAKRKRED